MIIFFILIYILTEIKLVLSTRNRLSGQLINPILLLSVLKGIIVVDFLFLIETPQTAITEPPAFFDVIEVQQSLLLYIIINIIASSITIVCAKKFKGVKYDATVRNRPAAWIFLIGILFCLAFYAINIAIQGGGIVGIAEILAKRQTYDVGIGLASKVVLFFLSSVSLLGILCIYSKKKYMLVFMIFGFFSLFTGSRNLSLLLIYCSLVYFSFHGFKISAKLLPLFIVAIFIISVQYNLYVRSKDKGIYKREITLAGNFFNTVEFPYAESITLAEFEPILKRPFTQSLLAFICFPIPRDLYPDKPIGASGHFTSLVFPRKYETTRSEILTTGFGNCIMELGIVFGSILYILIIFILNSVITIVARSRDSLFLFLIPILFTVAYIFQRGDIFNTATYIIPFLIVATLFSKLRVKKNRVIRI